MYREQLYESNKSQLREKAELSMKSPTTTHINDSLSKIVPAKKSVSSERKNHIPPSMGQA